MAVVDAVVDARKEEREKWRPGFVAISFDVLRALVSERGWQDPWKVGNGMPDDALITRVETVYEGPGSIVIHFLTQAKGRMNPLQPTVTTYHGWDKEDADA